MSDPIQTVGDLIARLSQFDPALPVSALWDTVDGFDVHRVGLHPDGSHVVIDVGEGDGDWDVMVERAAAPPDDSPSKWVPLSNGVVADTLRHLQNQCAVTIAHRLHEDGE